jgi:hypothetical protein
MTCVRSGLAALVAYLAVHLLGVVVRGIMGAAVLLQVRKEYFGSWGVLIFGSAELLRCHSAAGVFVGVVGALGFPECVGPLVWIVGAPSAANAQVKALPSLSSVMYAGAVSLA